MSDLSEIVFENVPENQLTNLVDEFLCSNILTATINGEDISENLDTRSISNSILTMQDGDAFFNLSRLYAFGLEIQSCSVQIIKYDGIFDFNLIFEIEHLKKNKDESTAFTMQKFAQKISEKYKIKNFYGGLEPAHDYGTRYFTRYYFGPLA